MKRLVLLGVLLVALLMAGCASPFGGQQAAGAAGEPLVTVYRAPT